MAYSVELYFDPETEKRIKRLWAVLSERGIPALDSSIYSRPHISLAVFDEVAPEQLADVLFDIARNTPPIEVGLSSVASFPGRGGVLFLAPTASKELLRLHDELHIRLRTADLKSDSYYLPGQWVPHCTIATNLTNPVLKAAFEVARQSDVFGQGRLTSIGLVRFPPVQERAVYPLQGVAWSRAVGGPPADRSNGYERVAAEFVARHSEVGGENGPGVEPDAPSRCCHS